jgi:adenosylhomocysteine nucleosidase
MIVVIAAIRDEIADFLTAGDYRESGRQGAARHYVSARWPEVAVVVGGAGRGRAEAATREALERYEPDLIVSAGFAGGVAPGLSAGDLVLCDWVKTIDEPQGKDSFRDVRDGTSEAWLSQIAGSHRRGGCLTVTKLVTTSEAKRWLAEEHPVDVVDMESYWVVETATQAGVSSIVVRSVLDPVERTLPALVTNLIGAGTLGRWIRGLAYVAVRPWSVPDLLTLARDTAVARDALGDMLEVIASTPLLQTERQSANAGR